MLTVLVKSSCVCALREQKLCHFHSVLPCSNMQCSGASGYRHDLSSFDAPLLLQLSNRNFRSSAGIGAICYSKVIGGYVSLFCSKCQCGFCRIPL